MNRKQDDKGHTPGFTLLEVMVSMAILATAFVAVLKLHGDSMEMIISSRISSKASELAQLKLTEIELTGLKGLPFMSGNFDDVAPEYSWNIDMEPTPLDPWVKVTVSVRHRTVGSGGGFRLSEYMLREPVTKGPKK